MTLQSHARHSAETVCPAPLVDEELSAELARRTAERNAAMAEVATLRGRLDHEVNAATAVIERLTRELRDARLLVLRSEAYRSDRSTLERMADLLGSGLAVAGQNEGLELLQGNLGRDVAAWQAEVAAELAAAKAERESALVRHRAASVVRIATTVRRLRQAAGVLYRRARGGPAPSASPPVVGFDAGRPGSAAAARVDAMVRRIETEITLVGDLLRGLSNILGLRTGTEAVEPGSNLYRALPLEGQLAAWIRFDAARQRRPPA